MSLSPNLGQASHAMGLFSLPSPAAWHRALGVHLRPLQHQDMELLIHGASKRESVWHERHCWALGKLKYIDFVF